MCSDLGNYPFGIEMQERIELAETALCKGLTQLELYLCITLTRDMENSLEDF